MSNFLSVYLKKKMLAKGKNLISFDEPLKVMSSILSGCRVTGLIDAGASNGRLSVRMRENFPDATVYAFEPNPEYREILESLEKQDPKIKPQYLALSDSKGQFDLNITASKGNTSLLKPSGNLHAVDPEGSVVSRVEKVEVTTIDDWISENGGVEIQAYKFDIQGNELKALEGAKKNLSGPALAIYTEICFNPLYEQGAIFSDIDQYLRQYGFELFDIYRPKYGPSGLIMWANAIYVHRERIESQSGKLQRGI
jgi:FkbM family methyltransferase